MTTVVIGAADQSIASDLRTNLNEIEDLSVVYVADSTGELVAAVLRLKPDVVFVHDLLGPEPSIQTIRDLSLRAPAAAMLLVTSTPDTEGAVTALESGAKGVISYPLSFEELLARVASASEWSERMQRLLSGAVVNDQGEGARGRLITITGSKGGVGTTTVATHLAFDINRKVPNYRVCLVDLDVQAGDIAGILEARQRVSIADVARVAEDLSARTVTDAVVLHDSGIHLLLAPLEIRDTEFVGPSAVRAILSLLKQEFDIVIVDGGSHVTAAQAAAVEVADEVIAIVTPDVLSMRSWRRVVAAWESLGVRTEDDVHLLINRVSRDDVLNGEAIEKLTAAHVLSTRLPAMFRALEGAVNARSPEQVREGLWWKALEAIGREVGIVHRRAAPAAVPAVPPVAEDDSTEKAPQSRADSRRARRAKGKEKDRGKVAQEAGQIVVETTVLVPLAIVFCMLAWQLTLVGLGFVWSGQTSNAAASSYARDGDLALARVAARDSVPDFMGGAVSVSSTGQPDVLRVSVKVPLVLPDFGTLHTLTTEVQVLKEPGSPSAAARPGPARAGGPS